MRIVRPGCVVGPQQQYMYCKQLEWAKWAAVDEMRRTQAQAQAATTLVVAPATPPAESDTEMANATTTTTAKSKAKGKEVDMTVESENVPMPMEVTIAFPPSTPPGPMLPPVTPNKHVAAAAAKAKSIAPPGQPRKTPNSKRVAVDSSDEEDAGEEEDTLPALGVVPPAKKAKAAPPRGITASEQRPARVTRSTAGAMNSSRRPGTALSSTSNKANAAPPPNKIPRLTHGSTTRSTAATKVTAVAKPSTATTSKPSTPAPTRRSQRPVSPVPSRLPTLVPLKRPHHTSVSSMGDANALKAVAQGKAGSATGQEWMKTGAASAVVKPGNPGKGERPGLRSVRRRRSSFSSADVVA